VLTLLAAATKPAVHSAATSPCALKNNVKKEDGGQAVESGLSSDQLVPDYAAGLVNNNTTSKSAALFTFLLHT